MTDTVRVPRELLAEVEGLLWLEGYEVSAQRLNDLLAASPQGEDAEEAYQIGKRDGYENAIQDIDVMTGGDGEYVYSTISGEGCPDVETMKARIYERFDAVAASPQGGGSSADADTDRAAEGFVTAPKDWMQGVWNMGNDALMRLPQDPQGALVSLTGAMMALHAVMPASAPPAEPEWITHDGGPNPVPGKKADVRFSDGAEDFGFSSEYWSGGDCDWWRHESDNPSEHIIAYRVTEGVKP